MGGATARCGRAILFRRTDMVARAGQTPSQVAVISSVNRAAAIDSRNALDETHLLVDRGAMPDSLDTAIYLERIDARRNMARYYMLSIQPNLFGGISFIRQWGRIGTAGRQKIDLMDDIGAAHAAREGIERVKRRRGYIAPNVDRSSVTDEDRAAC